MFNKRNKVYYSISRTTSNKFPIDEVETDAAFNMWAEYPAIKSCDWLMNMPPRSNMNTKLNRAQQLVLGLRKGLNFDQSFNYNTIKICQAIKSILINSIVVKSACDIDVYIADVKGENGEDIKAAQCMASDMRIMRSMMGHPPALFTHKNSSVLKNYVNLKIDTHINLHCKKSGPIFLQPMFHNPDAPWKVIPAHFIDSNKSFCRLVFNVMIPEDTKPFSIKAGDALFYVFFNEPIELIPSDKVLTTSFKTKFNKPATTITKNI